MSTRGPILSPLTGLPMRLLLRLLLCAGTMPSVARPNMWGPGQVSSRYPKPLTNPKAREWSPPKPPKTPKRVPPLMNSDWRPKLTAQADGWEAEADRLEAAIKEGKEAVEVPCYLKIEIDLGLLLIKMDKMKVKVEHQLKEWDKTGDGTISKGEFRLHLRSLGLEHATAEVDELFDKYDNECAISV